MAADPAVQLLASQPAATAMGLYAGVREGAVLRADSETRNVLSHARHETNL